jgi:ferredoxin
MKRKIIKINEEKCNGCGACIPDCPEGALQVIDGKARLVSDLFCDGLGACIKACPQDAMTVEEREAEAYDEYKVMENIVKAGENTIKAHLKHLQDHGEDKLFSQAIDYLKKNNIEVPELEIKPLPCGCPGTMQKDLRQEKKPASVQNVNLQSELNNWPIQLKLLNPHAPYLKGADLVIAADCTAFAYANFHQKFLKNKVLIMLCPKLDTDLDSYVEKLSVIFQTQEISSITLVHMEVPCCGGVEMIIKEAMKNSGTNIIVKDYTVSISGELI